MSKVVCVDNEDNHFFSVDSNSPLLEVGKEYTISDIEVHSWHTEVRLEEFPGVRFNSTCFDIDDEDDDDEDEDE